ncbi:PREDICTED: dehydrogenase/reductase SDR family member 7B-like [Erythranthe guttata]|uniref:dehydrogenase/reductase SDR family member 7B-like n=1 Tax=Erythranthe guttata TaxID=4155 RepID=UPI00064E0438|nr:PREDICTED: dehydrogenase/reductase SDR family member 7B-like [Erythranthe guttata]|eukprot:XP_012857200.1 PREDICTED: dehydrogenase/reductase SDR family member 7B-like [Erythranthe guttata]
MILEPWSRLEGKTVMVTGASSGLGFEFCLDLAKAGCRIVAAARRIEKLESLCQQINNNKMEYSDAINGGARRAIAVELDVTADPTAIEECVRKAWDAFGHIDALINNAGFRGKVEFGKVFAESAVGGMESSGENKLDRILACRQIRRQTDARRRPWRLNHQHLINFRPKSNSGPRSHRIQFLESWPPPHDQGYDSKYDKT